MSLHVVGVRHHSPACARLVHDVIARVRPRHVLIEGPADFNPRLDELRLAHLLPLAIFTYYQDATRRHASWTPFCAYSPEWVALTEGRKVGASLRFCDLPAWHPAFEGQRNRYADDEGARERTRTERAIDALCARTRTDDLDSLWDHLFEVPAPSTALAERLECYFEALRGEAPGGARDGPREALMARWVAWALREAEPSGGAVLLVCGGWHAPRVKQDALTLFRGPDALEPPALDRVPELDDAGRPVRHGSYLVPYTYKRLDAFAGYDSGMPSPAYHEWVYTEGHEAAADRAIAAISARVRRRKQPLSTADLIAARALTLALANLRGHALPMRTDVLDGVAGALVKGGLEVPFPWARRGPLSPRTEPLLVEVVAALSGDREGRLDPATPRPPLAADVEAELLRHDIELTTAPRALTVSLARVEERTKSRVLHRLALLAIPGVVRERGPAWATDALLEEGWRLSRPIERDSAIIEASQWGATLEGAALARLEAAALEANGSLRALAQILGQAVFVGIDGLEARIVDEVARAVSQEPSLAELGEAASRLLDLTLHGALFGAERARAIETVLVAAFDRGLWLLEGLVGANARLDEAAVKAVVALRDLVQRGPQELAALRPRADGVLSRRAVDPEAPPAIRGACLGALWSLGGLGDPEAASAHAIRAVRAASLPTVFGDFLVGLFATARQEVLDSEPLVGAIDEVLLGLGDHETMVALPSMRTAFAYFPPRERERIARLVLTRHGGDAAAAHAMVARLSIDPADVAEGLALDHAVRERARRYGLADALDGVLDGVLADALERGGAS